VSCVICLEDSNNIRVSDIIPKIQCECNYYIHKACWDKWCSYKNKPECVICHTVIIQNINDNEFQEIDINLHENDIREIATEVEQMVQNIMEQITYDDILHIDYTHTVRIIYNGCMYIGKMHQIIQYIYFILYVLKLIFLD